MTNLTDDAYEEIILNTIDNLRQRKARPDFDRICHMIQRKHDIKADATRIHLERLVNERVVIKVDYKGSTSYRNAAKWKKARHFDKAIPAKMVTLLTPALRATMGPNGAEIGDIVMWFQRYLKPTETLPGAYQQHIPENNNNISIASSVDMNQCYASLNDIAIKAFNRDLRMTLMEKIGLVLKREVFMGNVIKLMNGHYALTTALKQLTGTPENLSSHESGSMSDSNRTFPMDLSRTSPTQGVSDNMIAQINDTPASTTPPSSSKSKPSEEDDLTLTVADVMGPMVFIPKADRIKNKIVAIKPKPSLCTSKKLEYHPSTPTLDTHQLPSPIITLHRKTPENEQQITSVSTTCGQLPNIITNTDKHRHLLESMTDKQRTLAVNTTVKQRPSSTEKMQGKRGRPPVGAKKKVGKHFFRDCNVFMHCSVYQMVSLLEVACHR